MDKQPEHGESIIQVDPPYKGHYCMGMRDYQQTCTFDELFKYCTDREFCTPNFFWTPAKDFPFPTPHTPEQS